jgi:hypothetical protein
MIEVEEAELGIAGPPLAGGAVGEIHAVGSRISNLPWPLVYKKVKATTQLAPGMDRHQILARMRRAVAVRDAMSEADRTELDDVAVWPLAIVRDGGDDDDAGVLLRQIPDDFFVERNPPGGPRSRILFELQLLYASDRYLTVNGIDRSAADGDLDRLALMVRLAYAVEVVHRHALVVGDLHPKNAAVASFDSAGEPGRRKPQVLLLDCDGATVSGPFFSPPEIVSGAQQLPDERTDVFRLGLCIVRCLARGAGVTQLTDPAKTIAGVLDQDGIDLLRRAVSPDRRLRPTAFQLRNYLTGRLMSLAQPAELLAAEIDRSMVPRGNEVVVRWTHRHGTKVRIYGVNGFEIDDIDPDAYPAGLAIRPSTAGPIYVEVSNANGADDPLLAGHIEYVDPPPLRLYRRLRGSLPQPLPRRGSLPRPVLPDVAPVRLPELPLPARPKASTDIRPVPRIELPTPPAAVADVDATGLIGWDLPDPGATLSGAIAAAAASVGAVVGEGVELVRFAVSEWTRDGANLTRSADDLGDVDVARDAAATTSSADPTRDDAESES